MTKVHHMESSASQLLEVLLSIENQLGSGHAAKTAAVAEVLSGAVAPPSEDASSAASADPAAAAMARDSVDSSSSSPSPYASAGGARASLSSSAVGSPATAVISPPLVPANASGIHSAAAPSSAHGSAVTAAAGGIGSHYFMSARGMRLFDPAVHKVSAMGGGPPCSAYNSDVCALCVVCR
jgi:hypothetical protein